MQHLGRNLLIISLLLLGSLLGSSTLLGGGLLGGLISLLLNLLKGASVDHLSGRDGNTLDQAALLEFTNSTASKRTVDLKMPNHNDQSRVGQRDRATEVRQTQDGPSFCQKQRKE